MNKYSSYTNAELEEHLSNYLIDSWSYSKVASFSRNEKEFEKREIYRERSRSSSSTVAGNAYHSALEYFFMELHADNTDHGNGEGSVLIHRGGTPE